ARWFPVGVGRAHRLSEGPRRAVRVALETWAATDAAADGPGSPAELAVRCLRHLLGGTRPSLTAGGN
ncbi:hypothetical protein AB0885_33530, partial [Streptomyces sp. NPDC005534]